jgi:3-keto-5-aminohexanoate cleavage enzyme
MDKAIITCAVTGVLTDPKQHPVPVTVEQMAESSRQAFEAGAAIVHLHFRRQEPGLGHLPTWDPEICAAICDAVRSACPGIIINMSTGVMGADIAEPVAALRRVKPEIAACNAGTLNYLKTRSDGSWAWPPLVFDNPVSKVQAFLDVMNEVGTRPEFECFDTGILRSVGLFVENKMASDPHCNFVMGVASGMAAEPDLLPLLRKWLPPGASWEVTAIGRADVWPLHQRAAELGGSLRTGLEDTFYLPNGDNAKSNGELIAAIAKCAERAGRGIASPAEARAMLHLRS